MTLPSANSVTRRRAGLPATEQRARPAFPISSGLMLRGIDGAAWLPQYHAMLSSPIYRTLLFR